MYNEFVETADQAVCHLFLHCCCLDGEFSEAEADDVADKFVRLNLQHNLNFKEELHHYKTYIVQVSDERAYLAHLIKLISPVNELALFSYCIELGVTDLSLDNKEIEFFEKLGEVLNIGTEHHLLIQKLMIQRQLVANQKYF
jgi:glutaredoxin 2